jgi:hypothetical protein
MEDVNSKNGFKKSVWKIRDYIQELEDAKDQIIEYLGSGESMWITDAKEFYFSTVSAWEMLRAASEGKLKYLDNSKEFLNMAKSRLAQSMSELEALGDNESTILKKKANTAFEKCWDAFNAEFKVLTPKLEPQKPTQAVTRISDIEYHLPCSVCGKIAVIFKTGVSRFGKNESLLISGLTRGISLNIELASKAFDILEQGKLSDLHEFIKKYDEYEGLDAYCPECNKIYCSRHYNTEDEWDQGFYDCTYGTCPKDHTRMIND